MSHGGKWKAANVQKMKKKKQLYYKRQMSQVAKSTTVIEKRQKVKGK